MPDFAIFFLSSFSLISFDQSCYHPRDGGRLRCRSTHWIRTPIQWPLAWLNPLQTVGGELHHDEWLLADLEALGQTREQVLESLPSPTAAALVLRMAIYWIFHAHPVSLLGYLAVLEGEPPSTVFLEEVVAKSGLPAKAFRTFIRHGHLDPQHRDDLNDALDRMPLNTVQGPGWH